MKTSELFGKEVMDININKIGKVSDIEFDMYTGTISHIIVKSGLAKKYSVAIDKIDKIGDGIVLNIELDEIK